MRRNGMVMNNILVQSFFCYASVLLAELYALSSDNTQYNNSLYVNEHI